MNASPALLLALTLWACRPPSVGGQLPDALDSGPGDAPGDTGSGSPVDTGGGEQIPSAVAQPVFQPPGGGFVDAVTVTLTSPVQGGELLYCVSQDPGEACALRAYEQPFDLAASSVVHARLDVAGLQGATVARSFVEVHPQLADFSSDVPVFVFWTDGSKPTSSTAVAMGVTLVDPAGERAWLTDSPVESGRCRLKTRGAETAKHDLRLWRLLADGFLIVIGHGAVSTIRQSCSNLS